MYRIIDKNWIEKTFIWNREIVITKIYAIMNENKILKGNSYVDHSVYWRTYYPSTNWELVYYDEAEYIFDFLDETEKTQCCVPVVI